MTGHTPTVRKVSTTVARPLGVPFQWKDVASDSKARIPVTRKAYLKLEDAVLIIWHETGSVWHLGWRPWHDRTSTDTARRFGQLVLRRENLIWTDVWELNSEKLRLDRLMSSTIVGGYSDGRGGGGTGALAPFSTPPLPPHWNLITIKSRSTSMRWPSRHK